MSDNGTTFMSEDGRKQAVLVVTGPNSAKVAFIVGGMVEKYQDYISGPAAVRAAMEWSDMELFAEEP